MRLPGALILAAGVAVLAGCPRREEATRVVVRSNRLPDGLFDRLTIEVRRPGATQACAGCVREFAASELTGSGVATFALASLDEPPVVQVMLWRSRGKAPRASAAVTVTGTFAAGAEVEVRLPWDAVGRPVGSWSEPVDLGSLPALPGDPVVGGACAVAPADDEVCVPGALFWFGDPSVNLIGGADREGNDERLVLLSPFLIDAAEVTVGQFRASKLAALNVPIRHEVDAQCSYTEEPGASEDVPVTCAIWPMADAHCRQRGRRLPTEAELEFLMGGRGSRRYVWGDDMPECGDTIFGERTCGLDGPAVAGQGTRDRLRIGDRTVLDLTGNVSEWTADRWNSTREGCFAEPLLRDPRCEAESPSSPGLRVVRGGSWLDIAIDMGASLRFASQGTLSYNQQSGWRCAREAGP